LRHGQGISIREVIRAVERATGEPLNVKSAPRRPAIRRTDRRRRQDQGKVRLAAEIRSRRMVVSALKWERCWRPRRTVFTALGPVEELTDGYGRTEIEKLIQLLAKLPGLGRVRPEGGADHAEKARHDH